MSALNSFLRRCGAVLAGVCVLCGTVQTGQAASPRLSAVVPYGAQRGTDVEVRLAGANLQDAQEILLYDDGIEVTAFEVAAPNQVKATLRIAPDCRLGAHRLRIRTATGISDLRTFHVGALPVVDEKEPNSEFSNPQKIPLDVTVHGTVTNEDVDYFVVEAKAGERITAEVEAIRLGVAFFDVFVAILDEARFELATSDDNPLVWQDGIASVIAPADGRYIIQVRDSAYGGNGNYRYRLHVGRFPRPLGVVPSGGRPGETVEVRFLGDLRGEFTRQVTLPAEPPLHQFGLFAEDESGVAPSPNWFRLSDLNNVLEAEPNEGLEQATRFEAPAALNGVLEKPGDVDRFRFAAKKGQRFDVVVYARQLRSAMDSVLSITDEKGRGVASNDDSGGPDSRIRFTAPRDGEFVIAIRDHLNEGGPAYTYRIEVAPVKPQLVLTTNEFRRYVQPTVYVPRGNRYPLLISASRRDFGGALSFRGEDLPQGVTLETPGMPANLNVVQVLFHAAPDAPVAGSLARIVGTFADGEGKPVVEGELIQDVVLVRGQNQRPVWTERVRRLPVAVIEEAPFEIALVQPKVPIVRGGSMNLKVVAKRKEGFDAPIKVNLLWNPPGIGSSTSVSIPQGKSEALIPINASGNAPIAEWPIAVRGEATVGNGMIRVATPFAKLRVSEPYFALTFHNTAVELGTSGEMVVEVKVQHPFEGKASVQLLGLPAKVTTQTAELSKETDRLVFPITAAADARPGLAKNIFCRIVVTENGEPVLHNLGSGQLRVDKPLPKKVAAKPAPTPKKKPEPKARPLSRLEKLRLERKAREEARKNAAKKPAEPAKGS